MNNNDKSRIDADRRQFLIRSMQASAGLLLGLHLPASASKPLEAGPGIADDAQIAPGVFEPNAFIRIQPDNTVTVIIKHLEMGQGTYTGLATLVAEELDADWAQIQVEGAPANHKLYNNLFWGPSQGTGGSTAMANSFLQMRKAGAVARQMLLNAAAKLWRVNVTEIRIESGLLRHANGQQASFGALAELAGKEPTPPYAPLKKPAQFRLIGKAHLPRKDSHDKVTGKAIFTQDMQLPGMLTAVVAHPPRFGATVQSFVADQAKAIDGVVAVVQIPNGVAVLAKDFWRAKKGRDALQITWDESRAFNLSSEDILQQYKALLEKPGAPARQQGDSATALAKAAHTIDQTFVFPFLAHAPMEPLNCVVDLHADSCDIYNGEQFQTIDQFAAAKVLGLAPEKVRIHMLYAGGSFGRRANPAADFVSEAASIAQAIHGKAPVKMVWTREDDMRAGFYRPMYVHRIQAGLTANGQVSSWQQRIVGQSIIQGTPFAPVMIKDNVDQTSVEGAVNMPYAIPHVTLDLHSPQLNIPVLWWRSVGSTHTAFAVETMIDALATTAGADPVDFRRGLLKQHPRHLGVLEMAAQKSDWGQPMAAGRGRGIAVHKSFNTYVAQVAEVTVRADGGFSVDRVVIAVDCGIAVNPDIIRAQMEGGMGFGLSATLMSELTFQQGRVVQSNFHDFTMLRINQMPKVEVYIIASDQPPTGVGEPGTPVIAPAVANALYQATGRRYTQLPLPQTV